MDPHAIVGNGVSDSGRTANLECCGAPANAPWRALTIGAVDPGSRRATDQLVDRIPWMIFSISFHGALVIALSVTWTLLSRGQARRPGGASGALEGTWQLMEPAGSEATDLRHAADTRDSRSDAFESAVESFPVIDAGALPVELNRPNPPKAGRSRIMPQQIVPASHSAHPRSHEPHRLVHNDAVGAGDTALESKGGGSSSSRQGTGGSSSGVRFFGIAGDHLRIVYVIDCSGSMAAHGAMRRVKEELLESLSPLRPPHRFHLVFYNQSVTELKDRDGEIPSGLLPASDANRAHARQLIASVQPDGRTDHMPALRRALALKPDAIYFLTDAGEPLLTREDVHRLNPGGATIHCIEFGTGHDPSPSASMLKVLAQQSGGEYQYIDIRQPVARRQFER